jgi:hypothetical protein
MKRTAQVQSQMFIYILSIIVIGLLLFFGIKWIGELMKTSEKIDATKLTIDLENAFDVMRSQYGSTKTYKFYVPKGIDKVCFVDSTVLKTQLDTNSINYPVCDTTDVENYNPLICLAWKDNTSSILFSPALDVDVNIGHIEILNTQRSLCYDITKNRNIELRLIGLGDGVKLESI